MMDTAERRHWRGWSDAGVRRASKSGLYHQLVTLDDEVDAQAARADLWHNAYMILWVYWLAAEKTVKTWKQRALAAESKVVALEAVAADASALVERLRAERSEGERG